MRLDVAATPVGLDAAVLSGAVALVVDVLRASTTMIAALASGCAAVIPVADPAEAWRRAATLPGALVAGERRGEPVAGFDLGNSPLEFTPARVRGRLVIFTTSNGTRALLAARGAARVGVAALVNLSASAEWAAAQRRDIVVVCAGERGAGALEDWICAGLLVERLAAGVPPPSLTARALEAARAAAAYGTDVVRLARDAPWARRLTAAGRGADVAACLRLDATTLVPEYCTDIDKVLGARG